MSIKPYKNPDLVWRDEPERREEIVASLEAGDDAGEEGWVIIVDAGEINQLNLLAGDIWMLCDGERDLKAMAAELSRRYDAPEEEILADVKAFVDECVANGWLIDRG